MSPDELNRYRNLKDKVKAAQDAKKQLDASRHSQSFQKLPTALGRTPVRMATYAPELAAQMSMRMPSPRNDLLQPPNKIHRTISALDNTRRSIAQSDLDNISDMTGITAHPSGVRTERQLKQIEFKKAIRRGRCTLKELIDHFYVIEERHMLTQYKKGIDRCYREAKVFEKPKTKKDLPLDQPTFEKYGKHKKVLYKQSHIVEILSNESDLGDISLQSFNKLLILACCGGDRTKIGVSNFKKLMKHMDIER